MKTTANPKPVKPRAGLHWLLRFVPAGLKRPLYIGVKAVHSIAFLFLQSAILYLLYKGLRRQSDRPAAVAAAVVGAECAIYAGNGFRCPLTGIAEELGAQSGSVTDIFLPRWLAANIANIYAPLYVIALALHGWNLLRSRHDSPAVSPGASNCRLMRCRVSDAMLDPISRGRT